MKTRRKAGNTRTGVMINRCLKKPQFVMLLGWCLFWCIGIVVVYSQTRSEARQPEAGESASPVAPQLPAGVFRLEVDGRSVEVEPGGTFPVIAGSMIKLLDFIRDGDPLPGVVMPMTGFAPDTEIHTGDARGILIDTAKDLQTADPEEGKENVYAVRAEQGEQALAACFIKLIQPKLAHVNFRFNGKTETIEVEKSIVIPLGTPVEILDATFEDGVRLSDLSNLHVTLGLYSETFALPHTFYMREGVLIFWVRNGSIKAGRVKWVQEK